MTLRRMSASTRPARKLNLAVNAAFERLESRMLLSVAPLEIGAVRGRPGQFGEVNDVTLFTTTDFPDGQRLWSTDGTATGTKLVKDLDAALSTGGAWFVQGRDNALTVGNTFYFTGVTNAHGRELWRSDGTAAGTQIVADLVPGSEDSNPEGFVALDGLLIFTADKKIWRTDGTSAGTFMIMDADPLGANLDERMAVLGNHVYFMVYPSHDPYNGEFNTGELWRTDGTVAGTVMIRDISPGVDPTNVSPTRSGLINVGGTLFFSANDGVHGYELWRSNGTKRGTLMVRDLAPPDSNPFIDGSYPSNLTDVKGTLFFSADGALWRTDGTASGTIKLRELSNPRGFVNVNGTLFFAANDALWKSDGTRAGTFTVANVEPAERFGAGGTGSLNGRLYFGAAAGSGFELYETDGTPQHTLLAFDAEPGAASSHAQVLGRTGDKMVFTARSDSTAQWQMYALSIPKPYAPRDLRLHGAVPSHLSADESYSSSNRPTISGAAPADARVRMFADGIEIGSGVAANGIFQITATTALLNGTHQITASATDDLGRTSDVSDAMRLTIDTVAPRAQFTATNRDVLHLRFTEDLSRMLTSGHITLTNRDTRTTIPSSALQIEYTNRTNTAAITFPAVVGGLAVNNWRLTIDAGVTDKAGNRLAGATTFDFRPPDVATVGVSSRGVMLISGTKDDDTILLNLNRKQPAFLEVTVNGHITNHNLASLSLIQIEALGGNDLIKFDNSNGPVKLRTKIYGGTGDDTIFGAATRDRIYGGPGDDLIYGGGGHDIIYGELGNDTLFGERGNDYLVGGPGVNTIHGNHGVNRISFQPGIDRITLSERDIVLDTLV